MKILIHAFPTMGGSGMIATRLGLELAKLSEFDIHFLFYKRPFFLKDSDKQKNITFHQIDRDGYALFSEIGSPFTIQSASKMAQIVRKEKIDIIHSHYAIPHAVSSYLASQMSTTKTIVTTHGSDVHTLGKLAAYNSSLSLALKNTDTVTSVSNYLARETEEVFDLKKDSVPVIYDFVSTDLFKKPEGERELAIIQASNFRPVKQIPLLVELFAKVAHEFPDWCLKLVGDGPEATVTLRRARELKIKSQVKFLGVQKNIPDLFANASILASTSRNESFGLTIAEAMSCGTPVWVPSVGGIPELCDDGKTGYVYDLEDQEDAVDKLAKLMENEQLRRKMGDAARDRVIDKFSIPVILKEYVSLYDKIMS